MQSSTSVWRWVSLIMVGSANCFFVQYMCFYTVV
ncbi:hypothetical protein DV711_01090 [Motiliproteus coralliicola]|uniref:Uncharacterized protein n=1 Tax=Motiliproteus coralliicola TaxID=2283196 RepID=A0A369WXM7_9GAMM|nr:hypothetical protein DV711_01090 [Motiliproteus coralliicola]